MALMSWFSHHLLHLRLLRRHLQRRHLQRHHLWLPCHCVQRNHLLNHLQQPPRCLVLRHLVLPRLVLPYLVLTHLVLPCLFLCTSHVPSRPWASGHIHACCTATAFQAVGLWTSSVFHYGAVDFRVGPQNCFWTLIDPAPLFCFGPLLLGFFVLNSVFVHFWTWNRAICKMQQYFCQLFQSFGL